MKKETKVKCEVKNCKHNEEKQCDLDELDISCTCDNENCEDKKETICKSFEKEENDDEDATELEYEVLETEAIEEDSKTKEEIEEI